MDVRWMTVFIDRPASTFEAAAAFWEAATGSRRSAARGAGGQFATLEPADGDACLRVQRVDDGPGGSHLDLHVDVVREAVSEAVALGADVVADHDTYVILRSPGGLTWCLVQHRGEARRPAAVGSPGRRSLADQLSVDVAPDRYDAEREFWATLTGWQPLPARVPVLHRPPGMPFRLLFQRRGDAGRESGCHLDLASDDRDATVADHVALGAVVGARFEHRTVMADPSGHAYCVTVRAPA